MDALTVAEWDVLIDKMTHLEMAFFWRFAPTGHPLFNSNLSLHRHFEERFWAFGGMTPEISKLIGWERK